MLTASTCTLEQFMRMWFDENRADEEFEAIHLEYVDLSGLTRTRELELNAQIQSLQNRVERVKLIIYALRMCVDEFGKPFTAGIKDLNELGLKLYWDGDAKTFEGMLRKIEGKEAKFQIQLSGKQDELLEFHKAQSAGKTSIKQTRQQFIKNIIELRKRGHYIRESETTVETFALIVCSENDAAEKQALQASKKK